MILSSSLATPPPSSQNRAATEPLPVRQRLGHQEVDRGENQVKDANLSRSSRGFHHPDEFDRGALFEDTK
jgi:hypothetical protein